MDASNGDVCGVGFHISFWNVVWTRQAKFAQSLELGPMMIWVSCLGGHPGLCPVVLGRQGTLERRVFEEQNVIGHLWGVTTNC